MTIDPLDFAFFCIGVHETIRGFDSPPANGELEFVSDCIQFASALDVALDDNWAGVFAYDVAEPFGAWVAWQLSQKRIVSHSSAEQHVQLLIEDASK